MTAPDPQSNVERLAALDEYRRNPTPATLSAVRRTSEAVVQQHNLAFQWSSAVSRHECPECHQEHDGRRSEMCWYCIEYQRMLRLNRPVRGRGQALADAGMVVVERPSAWVGLGLMFGALIAALGIGGAAWPWLVGALLGVFSLIGWEWHRVRSSDRAEREVERRAEWDGWDGRP
jgi:hypothetical protein